MTAGETEDKCWSASFSKTVARKVKKQMKTLMPSSSIMKDKKQNQCINFLPGEIKIGKLIGSGGFSHVYEVSSFEANSNRENSPPLLSSIRRNSRNSLVSEQKAMFSETVRCSDTGESRYVVKHLKSKLARTNMDKFCLAAAELAVEAQYLSALRHPNIITIRGWANGGVDAFAETGQHDGYFLVLDRLNETLHDRITTWQRKERDQYRTRPSLGLASSRTGQLMGWIERTDIASKIASALQYLHSKNIIFRDLKPNNVGFDEDGTVKLFDFGLARELPSRREAKESIPGNDVFVMTGGVGTRRYMSPECILGKTYNLKADVYTWALVYWQMLALDKPYGALHNNLHKKVVCERGVRPQMDMQWPARIQELLQRSWSQHIDERPDMDSIISKLQRISKDLENDVSKLSPGSEENSQPSLTTTPLPQKTPLSAKYVNPRTPSLVSSFHRKSSLTRTGVVQ